jgi:hypothetical protein
MADFSDVRLFSRATRRAALDGDPAFHQAAEPSSATRRYLLAREKSGATTSVRKIPSENASICRFSSFQVFFSLFSPHIWCITTLRCFCKTCKHSIFLPYFSPSCIHLLTCCSYSLGPLPTYSQGLFIQLGTWFPSRSIHNPVLPY